MFNKAKPFLGLAAVVAIGLLSSCAGPAREAKSPATEKSAGPRTYPYKITTTVGMVTDIVRAVAGDRAEVTGIVGEGVDPHLYKPTRGDLERLSSADLIFYSGLLLEGKMADTLVRIARNRPVFAVTELVDEAYLLAPEGFAGHFDPHLWMDVRGWMKAVDAVAASLAEFDRANADLYKANAEAYKDQLHELDAYVRRILATVPEPRRILVTAHDAFNYFGRAYGLEVLGIQGLSTESEAGLEDINRLVDLLVTRKVPAVFVETSVADKNVRSLVEGSAARGHRVVVGGSLFSDAMGAPGTYEGTYIGMIDHNATTVVRALGGEAPAGGFKGKLGGRK